MTIATRTVVTRQEVEDFLYHEAALLDEWKLDEWQGLLADDATYYVPPNDQPEGSHRNTLFLVADDRERIRQRVIRINDPNCHAEYPKSRTRRMISNVRILAVEGDLVRVRDLPRAEVLPGCIVELRQGCDKRFRTCVERFGNGANFSSRYTDAGLKRLGGI